MIAVHNVVAALATVGLPRREGATLRPTILPTLDYRPTTGVVGLIAFYLLDFVRSADERFVRPAARRDRAG